MQILSEQLTNYGFVVTISDNADDTLKKIVDNNYDFAVVDMQMPDTTGLIVTKEIKKLKNGLKLPVILLSSINVNFNADNTRLFSSILLKPTRENKLLQALIKIFDKESISEKVQKRKKLKKFNNPSVLVAEDNLINQKVTASILKNMGITPDIVANGAKAFEACKLKDYKLVLMDVQMPEMDGLEATAKILDFFDGSSRTAPIILAMTANVMEESKNQCRNVGMKDFITKPVSPNELFDKLNKWL